MICITCVDALLGTDMERVCRKASDYAGVPVVPCYMYALTREGRLPPMVSVRRSVYSLLQPREKVPMISKIKDSNIKDLTEAEDIKKRWQEYTEDYTKKILMTWITTMLWSLT